MSTRRRWERRFSAWAFRRHVDSGEFVDFDRYAWAVTSGFERIVSAVAAVLLVGLWPLDLLIYPREPGLLAISGVLRLTVAAILIGGFTAATRFEQQNRNPLPVWIAVLFSVMAVSYAIASYLGDPTAPYVHTVLLVPLLTVTILVDWRARTLLTIGIALTALAAYFLPHPRYLATPHIASLFGSLVTSCVMSVALGHALYVRTRREFEARLDLRRVSRTDGLTALWNRGYLLERAQEEMLRARRGEAPLAVLIIDLDRFKTVNDRFGHAVGDLVLKDFVSRAAQVLRRTDILGRMGGEEFAVLLPDTPLVQAVEAAERLRLVVEESAQHPQNGAGPRVPPYTVSIGCGALHYDDPDIDAVLRRADRALYQAKGFGRNRVVSESSADSRASA